jgi:preprotein translocase subunit YajC
MPAASAPSPLVQLFPLALIFIIFYFLLIRPQKQKEKEHQKMLGNISKASFMTTSSSCGILELLSRAPEAI